MADSLQELIERLRAAGEGSRELDAEIAAAIRYFPKGVGFVWKSDVRPNVPEVGRVECCTNLGTGGPHYAAPQYSTSIDAALTLVPEGFAQPSDIVREALNALGKHFHLHAMHWPLITPFPEYLARFVCVAALRARTALSQDSSDGR